ncbi:MAG TPA: ATP-grasp domain-containing protein [Isosphaeraceae bacterium]|nr:ATP-grasp domain-containing protein [Isosphaeraceae bacterium]
MSSTPSIRVLVYEHVTGGGFAGQDLPESWAAEGHSMRSALIEDFAAVPGVHVVSMLDQRFPDPPGPWTTVRVGPGKGENLLSRLSQVAEYTLVVAPETGGMLTRCYSLVERGWLGCSRASIDLCTDKARLADHLREHGVRVPDHWVVHPGDPWPSEGPERAVLKPIDGAGSLDTRIVSRSPRLQGFQGPRLLQPFVPGTPMSASFLVDSHDGRFLLGVGMQRQAVSTAELGYLGGLIPHGDLSWADEAGRAVEAVPGLRGWVGVDFIRGESGVCTVVEINPRVTTSLVGIRSHLPSGLLARAWLACVRGDGELLADSIAPQVHARPCVAFSSDGLIIEPEWGAGE